MESKPLKLCMANMLCLINGQVRKIVFLAIICCAFSLSSCLSTTNVENGIAVDVEDKCDSADIFGEYIAIDGLYPVFSDSIYIASVDKIVSYKNKVYILDKQQSVIYVYNKRNKILGKAIDRRGHSKEEYLKITDFCIDKKGNLVVYDSERGNVNWYSNDAKYIKTMDVTDEGKSFDISSEGSIAFECSQASEDASVVAYYSGSNFPKYFKQEQLYRNLHVTNDNSIVWCGNDVLFTRPFDYTIYKAKAEGVEPLITLNFCDRNFDFSELRGKTYRDFLNLLHKNEKVLFLQNLNCYKDLYFLSTDNMDNILYDTKKDRLFVLSNIESPYGVYFLSALFVNRRGKIYTSISNDNVDNYLRPIMKHSKENNQYFPPLVSKALQFKDDNISFWLLEAHVRK